MIEIRNVTPDKVIKVSWHITSIICLIGLVWRLPEIITAIKL